MRFFAWVVVLALGFCVSSWAEEEKHGHEAVHGGCLNVVGSCENGHAELKIEGDTLRLWFVAGEKHTDKSVRVPDKEVKLSIALEKGKPSKELVLIAKPIELAEEKVGDCSYFEGKADWLKGVKEFEATGKVTFKGKQQDFKLAYPSGFDPDEDTGKKDEKAK